MDTWAAALSTLIRKLGHNLGCLHFGVDPDEYRYQYYRIGYGYDSDKGSVMCFNTAKIWYTDWYSAHHADINPLNNNSVQIV